ncbi:MAG: Hsp20/alpha crystallin family protein [bacterium]
MTLVRFNPVRDLVNIEREFNKMFHQFENRFGMSRSKEVDEAYENAVWSPLADISEDKDKYMLQLDLPGVTKEDLKLTIKDGQLCVSGERKYEKETKEKQFHRVERTFGKYYRSFTLPESVKEDKIEAEFKDGQLHINIPKSEEAKPKELEIKVK